MISEHHLTDSTCLDRFHLDRAAIQFLCKEPWSVLQGYPSGPWAIPLLQKVGFFRFLGIGSFQRAMPEIIEVSHLSELLSARLPGCHTGHLMGCMCFPHSWKLASIHWYLLLCQCCGSCELHPHCPLGGAEGV